MQIDQILYQLLLQHECVIVPNFGGFIVRESPCNFNMNKDVLKPYAKSVFFNPHLAENDGLLINAIMKTNHIGYAEANETLEKWIASLDLDINETGKTNINKIGAFYKGHDNGKWFTADSGLNLALETYGLRPVKVATAIVETAETEEHTIVYKPLADNKPIESTEIKSSKWKAWVAAATIALVAHVGYLSFEPKVNPIHQASIIPTISNPDTAPAEPEVTIQAETLPEVVVTEEIKPAETPAEEIKPEIKQEVTVAEEPKPVATVEPVIEVTEPATTATAVTDVPVLENTEKVIARYKLEQNALFHQKDLSKSNIIATIRKNESGLFEVIVSNSDTN